LICLQRLGKVLSTLCFVETTDALCQRGYVHLYTGTQQGAATDADGEYVIINVSPGVYSLRASFVGYGDQVVENVEVNSGFTTIVNFELRPGIELEEVVVLGERLIRQAYPVV